MKKEQLHIKNLSHGFSLVEILVSISIFLIFVIALDGIMSTTNKALHVATNKERATVLAEEGLEALRSIRDSNFANLNDGTYGLSTAGNVWSLSGASDLTDIFTRVLTISSVNENQKKLM